MFEKYDYKKMIVNERYLEVKRSRYNKNDSVSIIFELRRRNIFCNELAKKEIDTIEAKIHAIKINREDFEKNYKIAYPQKGYLDDALDRLYNLKVSIGKNTLK